MTATRELRDLDRVTILFSGDSGDGMQLTGTQFTNSSAVFGNDVCTLPDYPSEIRAPAGSLAGVSAFQLSFSSHEIHTPGDRPGALVAMNPAALRVYLSRVEPGGVVVLNEDAFTKGNLKKAGLDENPLDDPTLEQRFQLHRVPITSMTVAALADVELDRRGKQRCKNFFALGLLFWLYDRPVEPTKVWIEKKFSRAPAVAKANRLALEAGYHYGDTTEGFAVHYRVPRAPSVPGDYRIISGNTAFALGSVSAARLAGKPLVYSSYPITPATDVLHELAKLKHFDVRTIQCEDEIAAMGSSIGAAFGGVLAMTGTSGPGICLKAEAIGLAIMAELPLVVLNVQRGGPSTGLPTKTEQADLLQALYGRNGESPMPVLAPSSPGDCFEVAIEAFRIAVRHMTPVFVLSDSYVANGAAPWRIPKFADLEPIPVDHPTETEGFQPYSRDEATLARPWAVPGTPGLEHRIGGLEKQHVTGEVNHEPANHAFMCKMRADKVARVAEFVPEQTVDGPSEGDLLVVGWGGTHGAISSAARNARDKGLAVSHAHLRYLNPFPRNFGELLGRFNKVLIPELNGGQLSLLIRGRFMVDAVPFNLLEGRPFGIGEIEEKIEEVLS